MAVDDAKALLAAFTEAWNAHDIDEMMALMTEDCEFLASAGPDREGKRYVGREEVRRAYLTILEAMPDARWRNGRAFVVGDTAFTLWTLTGTMRDGTAIDVDGVDHFVLQGGLIKTKNAFRKARLSSPGLADPKQTASV